MVAYLMVPVIIYLQALAIAFCLSVGLNLLEKNNINLAELIQVSLTELEMENLVGGCDDNLVANIVLCGGGALLMGLVTGGLGAFLFGAGCKSALYYGCN